MIIKLNSIYCIFVLSETPHQDIPKVLNYKVYVNLFKMVEKRRTPIFWYLTGQIA